MPARPCVAQIVRRHVWIELGAPDRTLPGRFNMAAFLATSIGVSMNARWLRPVEARRCLPAKDRPLAMGQRGQLGDGARRHPGDPSFPGLGSPEDRAPAYQIEITPVELD